MRLLTFSWRTAKEILRDPLNLFFGLGFPLVLIGLLTAIQANIPASMFKLNLLTPGITVFGLSFMTLFSATLISRIEKAHCCKDFILHLLQRQILFLDIPYLFCRLR